MRIGRESLLRELELVAPGLSNREIVQQSTCFVFKGNHVHTFNDEVSCHAPCSLEDVEGAVQAGPFLELLRKMPEDDIDVKVTDKEIRIQGANRRGGVALESEISLPVDIVEEPKVWRPLPEEFVSAVSLVRECAGTDASRFNLTCLHFTSEYVEACDNHQLARYELPLVLKDEALVRKTTVSPIIQLEPTEYAETRSWLHFRCVSGLILSCRRYIEDDYPDLTKFLEVEGSPATLPKGIVDAAEKALIFSSENADEDKTRILVKMKTGAVQIEGRGPGGWYQEKRKINYEGPSIQFYVSAKLISEIVHKHPDCEIRSDRLKITNGNFQFVTCLGQVKE